MVENTEHCEVSPAQSFRDPASYYSGPVALILCVLFSPELSVLLSVAFDPHMGPPYLLIGLFAVFSAGLLTALVWPRDRKLLRRALKAALASFILFAVIYMGLYLVVSVLQERAMAGLGNRWRDYFKALFIALNYELLLRKLSFLIPPVSFAALWLFRRYWNLSAALLFAMANVPFLVYVAVSLFFYL